MGVIQQPLKKKVVIAELNSGENSTAPPTDDESVVSSGQATPVPVPANRTSSSAVSPGLLRRGLGYKLRMKQGRRTKQRCENEKLLMAMYGIDCEENMDGNDIPQASRSYFQDLLHTGNEELLEQFVNNEEPKYFSRQKLARRTVAESEVDFEPEEAFLKIGSNMRHALKKHLPLGILEGIESKVTETFLADPNTEFIADDLSSFERLMLHALCAYNALNSHSFDFGGKRIVRVENPYGKFFLRDPSLCKYLAVRGAGL